MPIHINGERSLRLLRAVCLARQPVLEKTFKKGPLKDESVLDGAA
jgi:hypothetical protein